MPPRTPYELFAAVARGELSPEEAERRLELPLPPPAAGFEPLGGSPDEVGPDRSGPGGGTKGSSAPFARIDHDRERRRGFPEVVFAPGKTPEQVVAIVRSLSRSTARTLVTRATPELAETVLAAVPEAEWRPEARALVVCREPAPSLEAEIGVVSAGTSDQPVAEEAALTAELMGAEVRRLYDVGVAGLHRLLAEAETLRDLHSLVVVAGMEAALAPVVAGLLPCPVIAVPTSTGYGASYRGLAALLALLNSCAPGVTVVNIDNGFGAGYAAALTLAHHRRLTARRSHHSAPP